MSYGDFRDDLPAQVIKAMQIVGNQPTWSLRNMVFALELMPPWDQTDKKTQTLAAAKVVLEHRKT